MQDDPGRGAIVGKQCRNCGVPLFSGATGEYCADCLPEAATPRLAGPSAGPVADTLANLPGPPRVQPSVPREFGDYELVEEIAEGGMGIVYKARDRRVHRTVALKMILAGSLGESARKRFQVEAEAVVTLDHPNIVPIYEVGEVEGRPFFTMKLIEGGNLVSRLLHFREHLREGARLMAKVARAVHHAHQRGVLHRDLKPGNILVDEAGEPFVTDFGLARRFDEESDLTHSGAVIGTPNFMAPEQAAGKMRQLTTAADVFSLGGILYNILTGQPPFRGDSFLELLQRVQHVEPARPMTINHKVDLDLETICLKCLEKEPQHRYRSALELAEDLERWLENKTIQARRASTTERVWKWARRRPYVAGLWAAVLAASVAGVAGVFLQWQKAEAARAAAVENARAERLAKSDAQRALRQTALLLTDIELEKAGRLLGEGNSAGGLAYLARVLRRDPTNRVAAQRLMATLRQRPFAVPEVVSIPMESEMSSARFSPDLKRVIIGDGRGAESRVWEVQTGAALTPALTHGKSVVAVAFSRDGQWVATGSADRFARVWDSRTGAPRTPPLEHGDMVQTVAFSPDGDTLLTASLDGAVRLWDTRTGSPLSGPYRHRPPDLPVADLSLDGRLLLTGGAGAETLVRDTLTGKPRLLALNHPEPPRFGIFSPDARRAATVLTTNVQLWDLSQPTPTARQLEFRPNAARNSIVFSHDGRLLVTCSGDHTARLWDTRTAKPAAPPLQHADVVVLAVFSEDDRRLLTASVNRAVQLWDVASGQPLTEPLRHEGAVLALAFGPGDREILVTSADHTIRRWSLLHSTPASLALTQERPGIVRAANFSPDGNRIVSGFFNGTARVLDAHTGEAAPVLLPHGAPVVDARFSPDGTRIVTAGNNREVKIWDAVTGKLVLSPLRQRLDIHAAQFNQDGSRVLVALVTGVYQVWDVATGASLYGPLYVDDVTMLRTTRSGYGPPVFSPDGTLVLFGSSGHFATLMDMAAGRAVAPRMAHGTVLTACQFSADGRRMITASRDNTARVWEAPSGKPLTGSLRHDGVVYSAALSHDGLFAVTASADKTARLWNAVTGAQLTDPLPHAAPVRYAEFNPDVSRVLTVSDDHRVHLWDVQTGKALSEPLRHTGTVYSAHFSPDGLTIITASGDGTARLWSVPPVPLPVPEWLPGFAEILGGERIDAIGRTVRVPLEELACLRETAMAREGEDFYTMEIRRLFEKPGR